MRYKVKEWLSDDEIRRAVESSKSFRVAARQLRLSTTAVREHAHRLNVRTRFRYGRELIPDREELAALARTARSVAGLAKKFGVTEATLVQVLDEHAIPRPVMRVRPGLPPDDVLRMFLWSCRSHSELARDLGVEVDAIRNQAVRLKIPVPSKRGPPPPELGDLVEWERRMWEPEF